MIARPVGDRVFVIPEPTPDKIGSIYIPDTVREESRRGLLAGTGKDCVEDIKVGSTVGYNPMGAVDIEIDGTKLLVMKESNLDYFAYDVEDYKEEKKSVEV